MERRHLNSASNSPLMTLSARINLIELPFAYSTDDVVCMQYRPGAICKGFNVFTMQGGSILCNFESKLWNFAYTPFNLKNPPSSRSLIPFHTPFTYVRLNGCVYLFIMEGKWQFQCSLRETKSMPSSLLWYLSIHIKLLYVTMIFYVVVCVFALINFLWIFSTLRLFF